jgi:MFS superfamily sulfate permease-like transporter
MKTSRVIRMAGALANPPRRESAARPLAWIGSYQRTWLFADCLAGVTLAAYAVPVALAYATLAGLEPVVGIYGYMLGGLA